MDDAVSETGPQSDLFRIPLPNAQTGNVSRTELIRLLADGMRELGYETSARTLETESGVSSASETATRFLNLLNSREFDAALALLDYLPFKEGHVGRRRAKNFIVQERYLDLLLQERLDEALARLHEEVYFLNHEDESDLDDLAALLACPTVDDLKKFAARLRAKQVKRFGGPASGEFWTEERSAIDCVRVLLDSDAVVPPNRLMHLLGQALSRQAGDHGDLRRLEGEALPLLRDFKEVEESRNAMLIPSKHCRHVIPIQAGNGPVEVWSVCIEDDAVGSRFAVGTRDGFVIVMSTASGEILQVYERVFGRNRPIVALDWATPHGLLAVSRNIGRPPSRVRADGVGSDEEDDDEAGDEETNSTRIDALVRRIMPSNTEIPKTSHGGRPFAQWIWNGGLVTAGPDGWIKVWSNTLICTSHFRVERVVDMVSLPDRSGVILACADHTLRVFKDQTTLFTAVTCTEPIVSIACGFSSLTASLRNATLHVWNLKDVLQVGRSNGAPGHHHQLPAPLVFKGFARKRYVLRPSVGHGDFVAIGGEDGNIHIYSCFAAASNPGKEVLILKGHTAPVNAVCFSNKVPGTLVSVGDDSSVRIWTRRQPDERE